jgi:hypothetical protein
MFGRAYQSPETSGLVDGRQAGQTSAGALGISAHIFWPWHRMTASAIIVPRIGGCQGTAGAILGGARYTKVTEVYVKPSNKGSVRILGKCGFEFEGDDGKGCMYRVGASD